MFKKNYAYCESQYYFTLKEEQNSTNVLEVSLVINHYYDMSRSLKWRAQRRKERQRKQQSNHTASYVP